MVDHGFDRILEAWESGGKKKPASEDFEKLVDKYPPDSGLRKESDAAARTPPRNPRSLPVDAELDLHGMTIAQAEAAANAFFVESRRRGYRKITLIHGKGNHSAEGGILKTWVQQYLDERRDVGARGYEPRERGGTGATWCILK